MNGGEGEGPDLVLSTIALCGIQWWEKALFRQVLQIINVAVLLC